MEKFTMSQVRSTRKHLLSRHESRDTCSQCCLFIQLALLSKNPITHSHVYFARTTYQWLVDRSMRFFFLLCLFPPLYAQLSCFDFNVENWHFVGGNNLGQAQVQLPSPRSHSHPRLESPGEWERNRGHDMILWWPFNLLHWIASWRASWYFGFGWKWMAMTLLSHIFQPHLAFSDSECCLSFGFFFTIYFFYISFTSFFLYVNDTWYIMHTHTSSLEGHMSLRPILKSSILFLLFLFNFLIPNASSPSTHSSNIRVAPFLFHLLPPPNFPSPYYPCICFFLYTFYVAILSTLIFHYHFLKYPLIFIFF